MTVPMLTITLGFGFGLSMATLFLFPSIALAVPGCLPYPRKARGE